jgi:hypothetical protein
MAKPAKKMKEGSPEWVAEMIRRDEAQSAGMRKQRAGIQDSLRSIEAMSPKPKPAPVRPKPADQPSQILGLRKGQGMKSRRGMLKGF